MSFLDWIRDRGRRDEPRETTRPTGSSGRGHTEGFLELEEFNPELMHPESHTVFDRMYRTDADAGQIIDLLANPIAAGTWVVEPYGGSQATDEDKEIAKLYEWALFEAMQPGWQSFLSSFLPVLFRSGFVPGEVLWKTAVPPNGEKLLVPRTVAMRLPRSVHRWVQNDQEELVAIEQWVVGGGGATTEREPDGTRGYANGSTLKTIHRRNMVYLRVGGEGDNWEGVSLLRRAYKHWYIKDGVERVDAVAYEREALGIPVYYPPPGLDDDTIETMDSALEAMRAGETSFIRMPGMKAGAGAPDGTGHLLELLGFDRTGSGRDPYPLLGYHTNKIAAAVIADFMKLGHGDTGARATAQVQADPFLTSIERLTGLIEDEWHAQVTLPFVAYNFKGAKNAPKLKMSIVDQTSLTQLADFVLKLVQVGAIMPDQGLENFLRSRADLPSADSEAVKDRGEKDGKLRRAVVGATDEPPPSADPFGANAPAGKHKDGKPAGKPLTRSGGKSSGAPKGRAGAGKGAPRGPAKNLWVDPDTFEVIVLDDAADARWRWRDPDGLEANVDLDALDEEMSLSGHLLEGDVEDLVLAEARGDEQPLADTIHERLRDRYRVGRDMVCDELGLDAPTALNASMDGGEARLRDRAEAAELAIRLAVRTAGMHAALGHGAGSAQAIAAAEQAGRRAARRMGLAHGIAAIQHGRHDQILDAGPMVLGVRYSAILDGGTCGECYEADDGVVRAMDDPVRLERRPPNKACASTASGANHCRCVEVPVLNPPAEAADEDSVTASLVARRGFSAERARHVAAAHVKAWSAKRGG